MSCLDDGLQLPFLSKTEIAERTEELLGVCWNGIHPVDIEAVCDYCGVAIVPVHGLMDECQVEAFMAADFKIIYVDEARYRNNDSRYRFSVAHELGHYVLHRDYYSSRVEGYGEWKGLMAGGVNSAAEFQANYFAGSLLVPETELIRALDAEFEGSFVRNCWRKNHAEFSAALKRVQENFRVSRQVIARRMRDLMPGAEGFDEVGVGLEKKSVLAKMNFATNYAVGGAR